MISALTHNVSISFILPFFYLIIESFLEDLELELLSYSSYTVEVFYFFENLIFKFNGYFTFSSVTVICIVVSFGLPILVMLITFYAFKQLDIRVN